MKQPAGPSPPLVMGRILAQRGLPYMPIRIEPCGPVRYPPMMKAANE